MSASSIPPIHAVAGTAGPAILLIHGFGADRMSWLANQQELAREAQVFALDLPGHAETPPLAHVRVDELRLAVERSIEAAGIGPMHIVAHSLGGAIAIALGAARPDLVVSLALIAPAGLGREPDADFLDQYPRLDSFEEAEALLRRLVARPRLINKFMIARVLQQLRTPGMREGLAAIGKLLQNINLALEPSLNQVLAAPRLTIWGEADTIVPLDRPRLTRFGGETLVLPDVAHLPHIESPKLVNQHLLDWLSSQR